MEKSRPETIENRWDILYSEYPDAYQEFIEIPASPTINLARIFDLEGKTVLDAGSGTGYSSFTCATHAKKVIGVEIMESMLDIAQSLCKKRDLKNVRFIQGDVRSLPIKDNKVDAVIGSTLAIYPDEGLKLFSAEAQRVTKNGGIIVLLNVAPGWYGGEFVDIIRKAYPVDEDTDTVDEKRDKILELCGYDYQDIYQNQEYGTLEKIIKVYGFIFGKNVIEHIRQQEKTSIRWKWRIRHKRVDKQI